MDWTYEFELNGCGLIVTQAIASRSVFRCGKRFVTRVGGIRWKSLVSFSVNIVVEKTRVSHTSSGFIDSFSRSDGKRGCSKYCY